MTENTPFDFVWLGLFIGVYDFGDSGMNMLLDQLEEMELTVTRTRLLNKESDQVNYESEVIAGWVAEEIREKAINFPNSPGIDIGRYSTELINSLRPAVWANMPQIAQNDFLEAEKS